MVLSTSQQKNIDVGAELWVYLKFSRDIFHYTNNELFVTSTNQNRHRRATLPELQALFHPPPHQPAPKDPPAHWYKAQLLHYGLQPSDVKGTAVKRLLDAVNGGNLEVPAHIRSLELDLKREWEGNERKAKREAAAAEKKAKGRAAGKSKKRKVDDEDSANAMQGGNVGGMSFNFNFSFDAEGSGASVTPVPAGNKRTKMDTGAKATKDQRKLKPEPKTKPKVEPKVKAEPKGKTKPEPKPKKEAGIRPESIARQETRVKHENPVPFSSPGSSRGQSLGLLNGVYDVDAFGLERVGEYSNNGCTIMLCLHQKSVWGEFKFCGVEGIIYFAERPWVASDAPVHFTYCGYDDIEGRDLTDQPDNTGFMRFLGNGRIEGCFEDLATEPGYGTKTIGFRGYRISGQETRPPRNAYSMRDEWNDRHGLG